MNNNVFTLLHTADWHLGHSLHGIDRQQEHEAFLQWLLEQLQREQTDALIIAGDVFDSANPPASAQTMLYQFLVQAKQRRPGLDMIIIGGNHDSAARLDAPSQLLDTLGIKVVGGMQYQWNEQGEKYIDWQRMIFPLHNKNGEINAVCGAMPFIRNADLPLVECDQEQADALVEGVAVLYQQLFQQMQVFIQEHGLKSDVKQVLTGHCYMTGTELSELSERRILGGNQHALPADIFNQAVDYVALGHLHKAQQVKSSHNAIHYSGSPLALSFNERHYHHGILRVRFTANTKVTVDKLEIPRAVAITVIPDKGAVTLTNLPDLLATQNWPEKAEVHHKQPLPLIEIRVLLEKPEPSLRQQVENLLESYQVRLLKLTIEYSGKDKALADINNTRLDELSPQEVFNQCYQRRYDKAPDKSICALFDNLLENMEEQN
jgi:exonuclease SbcD